MAVDPFNADHRQRLSPVIRYAFDQGSRARDTRKRLIDIYRDVPFGDETTLDLSTARKQKSLVNYFQSFVRGRLTTLAITLPKFSVKPRTQGSRAMAERVQAMLNRYAEVLNLHAVFKACAQDSAFGRSVVKVITSVAPKGVTVPYAPRAFRVSPDNFFIDPVTQSSNSEDAAFFGDVYLVPLQEARSFEGFDPEMAAGLEPYTGWGDTSLPSDLTLNSQELFAEDMTRLVDVYLPSSGVIATWQAITDNFDEISEPPLQVIPARINPYVLFDSISVPNSLEEYAPLQLIEELHYLANDMLEKAAQQARDSRRNPVGVRGSEEDMHSVLTVADGEPTFVDNLEDLDLYVLPGPDGSLLTLMQLAGNLLSSSAGNLEVALGQSPGASTARQTQALIGQLNSVQAVDRSGFEEFMAEVARRLATLAFDDEAFELEVLQQVPGTSYFFNNDWAPPHLLPRTAEIDNFHFEVVPFSSGFRSPQDRLSQLNAASQMLLQWMTAATQGAPINLAEVSKSIDDAFDLSGELELWWSGEKPTPAETAVNAYTSTARPSEGSTVNYQSESPAGGGAQQQSDVPASPGGFQGQS